MSGHHFLSRHHFCGALLASAASAPLTAQARYGVLHAPTEWSFESAKQYTDPFNNLELDVLFKAPSGLQPRLPPFWAGESSWRVRFAPQELGRYAFTPICSDSSNRDLHARTGTLEVTPYTGSNLLYQHAFMHVSDDH